MSFLNKFKPSLSEEERTYIGAIADNAFGLVGCMNADPAHFDRALGEDRAAEIYESAYRMLSKADRKVMPHRGRAKKKTDPAFGPSQTELPNLALDAQVRVIKGKHAGQKGKVIFARSERISRDKENIRLTIDTGSGNVIVDMEDIEGRYETLDIKLFMPEEERAALEEVVRSWRA